MKDRLPCGCIKGYHDCNEAKRLWAEQVNARAAGFEETAGMIAHDYLEHIAGLDILPFMWPADPDDEGIPEPRKRCWICNGSRCDTFLWSTRVLPDDTEMCDRRLVPAHMQCYQEWEEYDGG
jgi:hypothetical protein